MVLFVLPKFILQTHMRRHSERIDVWFLVRLFQLLRHFMCANSEGAGETVRICRLAWAIVVRIHACVKYQGSFIMLIIFYAWLYYTHTRDVIRYVTVLTTVSFFCKVTCSPCFQTRKFWNPQAFFIVEELVKVNWNVKMVCAGGGVPRVLDMYMYRDREREGIHFDIIIQSILLLI